MTAAAELIAERGWGRVTTRGVAERAGLPHGSVSYHFASKQELLVEAALWTFQRAVPIGGFAESATVEDLIDLIAAELRAIDPVLSRLMLESMREAERDTALRVRIGRLLADYRRVMIEAVRVGQERGTTIGGVTPEAVTALLGALGDGLMLHALLDPDFEVGAALDALRVMLRGPV